MYVDGALTFSGLCFVLIIVQVTLATLEGGNCTKNMTSTVGCSYSFMYS